MRIFITGATGLVGRRLVLDRLARHDQVVLLSRNAERAEALFAAATNPRVEVVEGDPLAPGAWQEAVAGCDAVVHLAGAGVADRRWTPAYKEVIVRSRIDSTFQVVDAMRQSGERPGVLVNASAVGWYGDTGARATDETAPADRGDFFGELCLGWEDEAAKAEDEGVRVVRLRIGLVLDERGGIVQRLARPFRSFVGGPIGLGGRYMPWIHWRDLIGLIDLALVDPSASGPMNAVAPNAVTNRAFSAALGAAMRRPSWLPVPPLALRIALGEFARYALMSQRIVPAVAERLGYRFIHPEIRSALEALLGASDEQRAEPSNNAVAAPSAASNGGPGDAPNGKTPASAPPSTGAVDADGPMPPAPVRIALVGVNGTLLRSDGRLPQGAVHACQSAMRKGCAVVLATARAPRTLRPIVQALGLSTPSICYNGAVIWSPREDRPLHHQSLDGALAGEVIAAARAERPDLLVGIEVVDLWYTDRLETGAGAPAGPALAPDGIGPLERFLDTPITLVNLLGTVSDIAAVRDVIAERYWSRRAISLFQPEPTLLQIAHPLVDKGIAVQRIAQRLGVDREAVMAVGDGANDAGMLEWAGFAVAVGNARAEVKALADVVVPSNDDQGVARALQRYVLADERDRNGVASTW